MALTAPKSTAEAPQSPTEESWDMINSTSATSATSASSADHSQSHSLWQSQSQSQSQLGTEAETKTAPPASISASASATLPSSSSSVLILTASDVGQILSNLDPAQAVASQAQIFRAFSRPSSSSAPAALSLSVSKAQPPAARLDTNDESDDSIPVQAPPRISLISAYATSLFMPSQAPSAGQGLKIVSIPLAGESGLPASTVLLDAKSGKVKAMVNARRLTALRNAAGSALFCQTFPAPQPPTNLLIFGTGTQAHAHAVVFIKLFESIKNVCIIGRRRTSRAEALVKELQEAFPAVHFQLGVNDPSSSEEESDNKAEAETVFNLSQAVHNANIILTLTPSRVALFNSVDVTSHTRLCLIGSYTPEMREVEDALILRSGVLVVDTREGCLKEAGEMISSGMAGLNGEGVVEIGECLGEDDEVREVRRRVEENGDVMIYESVGIGIQDIAIADLVLREAEAKGLGTVIPNYD